MSEMTFKWGIWKGAGGSWAIGRIVHCCPGRQTRYHWALFPSGAEAIAAFARGGR